MEPTPAAELYETIPRKVMTRLAEDGLISQPLVESDHHAWLAQQGLGIGMVRGPDEQNLQAHKRP